MNHHTLYRISLFEWLDSLRAGASNKLRAMFRAVYRSAAAFTKVPGADGKSAKSGVFPIRRGVLQGDITSPLYCILALDLIMRMHDNRVDKGVSLGATIVHTLGYADDIAMVDGGCANGVLCSSARVTAITRGSKQDADIMSISIPKTKSIHVRAQDPISETTDEEAIQECKFTCPHLTCEFKFRTKRGMLAHADKCCWRQEYKV